MEIQLSDKAYRRKCLLAYGVLVALGLVLIGYGLPQFKNYLLSRPRDEAARILLTTLQWVFLSLIPWSLYFCHFAYRVYKTERMPPEGQKVFRDTRVYRGKPARMRACLLLVLSLLIASSALFGAVYFPKRLSEIFHAPGTSVRPG